MPYNPYYYRTDSDPRQKYNNIRYSNHTEPSSEVNPDLRLKELYGPASVYPISWNYSK